MRLPRLAADITPLRASRDMRLLVAGTIVSGLGTQATLVALPYQLYTQTGSPFLTGLLGAVEIVPLVSMSLFGGALADRHDRRRLLLLDQVALVVTAGLLALGAFLGEPHVAVLYVLGGLLAGFAAVQNVLRSAILPNLVAPELVNPAIALNFGLTQLTYVVGPGLGGVLIATAGVGWCLLVNTLSYFAVLAGLLLMRQDKFFRSDEVAVHARPLRALREGLSYLRRSNELQALMGVAMVFGFFGFSAVRTLLSVLADDTLHSGAQTFGWLFAAYGSGAVVGGLASATRGSASWRHLWLGALVFSGSFLLLAPLRSPILCAAVLVAIGASWTTWASAAQSIAVLISPERMRGRVVSMYNSSLLVGVPFGALLDGWLADVAGTTLAFAIAGAAGLVATFAAALALRRRRALAVEPASV